MNCSTCWFYDHWVNFAHTNEKSSAKTIENVFVDGKCLNEKLKRTCYLFTATEQSVGLFTLNTNTKIRKNQI